MPAAPQQENETKQTQRWKEHYRGLDLPNIQTSLAVVKRLKLMDSGAIHLIGNLPLDAGEWQWRELCYTSLISSVSIWAMNNNGAFSHLIKRKIQRLQSVYLVTFIIWAILHISWQTEVSQLYTVDRGHQHIPCCDVSVEGKRDLR